MKMSTRGRYGVRAMVDIALYYDKGAVSLKDLARRQDLSEKYLEQLLPPLKSAGLVRSIRGAGGGYTLTRKPDEINLLEIVQSLENISPVDCLDTPDICPKVDMCVSYDVWKEIKESTNKILSSLTLSDMIEKHRHKLEKH